MFIPRAVWGCFVALLLAQPVSSQELRNGLVTVRAVAGPAGVVGFDVLAKDGPAAVVRFSSARLGFRAGRCQRQGRDTLVFGDLGLREDCGLRLGASDTIRVHLRGEEPYPVVAFDLTVTAFDATKWAQAVGEEPFHFLALYLPGAEVWHQRGWLNATPLADPFPLLLDRHAGTPEISAYHYNRNWSYTPPLGAHPLPVVGLWAPRTARYVGLEFQTTRLEDNSERDIATGYRWAPNATNGPVDAGPFVALVYPAGGPGYQQLVLPPVGARCHSRGTLLWSRALPATDDPNRFLWSFWWPRLRGQLPPAPEVADVSWIPGGLRQRDFAGPPGDGLIGGVEKPFQVPGTRLLYGWTWHNEFPTTVAAHQHDTARLQALEAEAKELAGLTKTFTVAGERCVYWDKPLSGAWTPEWGGPPVTTLHNANGFAAGRLFLGLYRDRGKTEYLPIVDGVLHWAKHIVWTRNEFADVPSSPFAIGGTLSASFCLDYYMTFRSSPDPEHRRGAREALALARAFTYRYLVMWPSDNNRWDNLDAAFLWEPNSGRDWTGAACANEVFWNLDTLAQTAVHTGDPVLRWAVEGSLSRWYLLYQDVRKDRLADYQPADMAEGYGLYAGNIYGVGARASYGFAAPLVMTEPVGAARARVVAGERAALVFRKGPARVEVRDYRYTPPGNLSFTLHSALPRLDLALTVPYVDLSGQPVAVVRGGARHQLQPEVEFRRPPQALWSLYLRDLQPDDQIIVGAPAAGGPVLPSTSLDTVSRSRPAAAPRAGVTTRDGWRRVPLPPGALPDMSWEDSDSWAGVPQGSWWRFGVPFEVATPAGGPGATGPTRLPRAVRGAECVYLLYSAGPGSAPALYDAHGRDVAAGPAVEALAWQAWPPARTARLLIARIPVPPGRTVAAIAPRGRWVWAATAAPRGQGARMPFAGVATALAEGAAAWERRRREEAALERLRPAMLALPSDTVVILPPAPGGPAFAIAQRAGLVKRARLLRPEALVNPARFNAQRVKVAIYLDGEDYLATVRAPGDGADAVTRYVKEGGTLVLLSSQPWPLYYATAPDSHRPEPLTERLGLPLMMALEGAPGEPLTVQMARGQTLVPTLPAVFGYPTGDPRLRASDRSRLPAGVHYVPIATVRGADGREYGDAAGLLAWPGGGRILYIGSVLLRDPDHGFAFCEAALRFVTAAAGAR